MEWLVIATLASFIIYLAYKLNAEQRNSDYITGTAADLHDKHEALKDHIVKKQTPHFNMDDIFAEIETVLSTYRENERK